MAVDHQKCTGCRLCEIVCSVYHTGSSNPSRSRIKIIKWEHEGIYIPLVCNHCEKAYCLEVCPTKACHREPEPHNRVVIDKNLCIGCKTCIIACPFDHPLFDPIDRVTVKCDYCDGDPQCVRFCEVKAVNYVEADRIQMSKRREVFGKFSDLLKIER